MLVVGLYCVKMLTVTPVSLSHHVRNMTLIQLQKNIPFFKSEEKRFSPKQLRVPAIVAISWF